MRYVIKRGDTLSEIAKRFNTSVASLVSANDIEDPNKIYAGHILIVPGPGGPLGSLWDDIKRLVWG